MSQFGSLANLLHHDAKSMAPEIGMGATILGYSDRYAATIAKVEQGGKRVGVQRDRTRRTDANGMSEDQTYEFAPDPAARIEWFTLRKNGRFVSAGSNMKSGTGLRIGVRDHYYDFSR